MDKVIVRVPATTANLGPGFDTLGLALQIYNQVEVQRLGGGLTIDLVGETQGIPRNEQNYAYEAVRAVFSKVGAKVPGLHLRLTNRIPQGRGLGSSAAAIVGGLLGANYLLDQPLAQSELLEIATAMEGHPDNVAPALFGGLVVASQQAGSVHAWCIQPPKPLHVILAIPGFALPTSSARNALPALVPLQDAVFNMGRVALLVEAFLTGSYTRLRDLMEDRLHQPYRSSLIPGFQAVIRGAEEAGALSCVLSGAGPTLVAFAVEHEKQIGAAMQQAFAAHGVTASIHITGISSTGSHVLNP